MDTKPLPNEKFICASNERFAIVKNLLVVSFGFTLLFTSYSAISYLQSSLNKVHSFITIALKYLELTTFRVMVLEPILLQVCTLV